jgi:hypothetical protein
VAAVPVDKVRAANADPGARRGRGGDEQADRERGEDRRGDARRTARAAPPDATAQAATRSGALTLRENVIAPSSSVPYRRLRRSIA